MAKKLLTFAFLILALLAFLTAGAWRVRLAYLTRGIPSELPPPIAYGGPSLGINVTLPADNPAVLQVESAMLVPLVMLLGPFERVISILCHVASRVLVLMGVAKQEWRLFWYGFLLLTALDTVAGYAHIGGLIGKVSLWWVELALLPFALLSVCLVKWSAARWGEGPGT